MELGWAGREREGPTLRSRARPLVWKWLRWAVLVVVVIVVAVVGARLGHWLNVVRLRAKFDNHTRVFDVKRYPGRLTGEHYTKTDDWQRLTGVAVPHHGRSAPVSLVVYRPKQPEPTGFAPGWNDHGQPPRIGKTTGVWRLSRDRRDVVLVWRYSQGAWARADVRYVQAGIKLGDGERIAQSLARSVRMR
jgi:hypothetical protein